MSDSAILGTNTHFNIRRVRRWPTPWLFGVLILPLGMYVGYFSTALPFLLSRAGVPVEEIARIVSLLYVPPILMFLWTPVADVKLRRRTWLVLGASVTAACMWVVSLLLGPSHLKLLTALLFFAGCVVALVAASGGGLMATMLSESAQSKAAGWSQAGNFGGGVLGAALVLWLVEHLSLFASGLATAVLVVLPSLIAFTVPEAPPTPSPWFRGRFAEMRKEALAVLRSPKRRWGVLLLIAPGSTCAAYNLLPALASSYGVLSSHEIKLRRCPARWDSLGDAAATTGMWLRHDLLAPLARLARCRNLAVDPLCALGLAGGFRPAGE